MRGLRGEAGPFELSGRRRAASDPDRLERLILYPGPILLVAGVQTSPKQARVYLRRQAVVFRPRFYPIRAILGPSIFPSTEIFGFASKVTSSSSRKYFGSCWFG